MGISIKITGISKSYGKNRALSGFTAELEPGIYALLGPNGSGKSTLMNIPNGSGIAYQSRLPDARGLLSLSLWR